MEIDHDELMAEVMEAEKRGITPARYLSKRLGLKSFADRKADRKRTEAFRRIAQKEI